MEYNRDEITPWMIDALTFPILTELAEVLNSFSLIWENYPESIDISVFDVIKGVL